MHVLHSNLALRTGGYSGYETTKGRKVFVGNLTFDVEEEDLYDIFRDCGSIEDVYIPRRKGFAFITYRSRE